MTEEQPTGFLSGDDSYCDDTFYPDDDGYYDDPDLKEDAQDLSCDHCGPWCPDWGGDGLCMLAIEQMASDHEFYYDRYFLDEAFCPKCKRMLPLYKVPGKLWQWPGDWLNPIIALDIYGAYDCPKGVVHECGADLYHVWVGVEGKADRLIATNCVHADPAPPVEDAEGSPAPPGEVQEGFYEEKDIPF